MPRKEGDRPRFDLSEPPSWVRDDPDAWRAWRRMSLRAYLRTVLFVIPLFGAQLILMLLTFRLHVLPETAPLWGGIVLLVIAAAGLILLRRRARRDVAEFAERAPSDQV